MAAQIRVLVVGVGQMGLSHALAYRRIDGFNLVGLCERKANRRTDLPPELADVPRFVDFDHALATLKPDAVAVCTLPDSHARFAIAALAAGAHVFVEKPLAESLGEAEAMVVAARTHGRQLMVGYILRHHPAWIRFIELARGLGTPLVMRLNLNQQSAGPSWAAHKRLLASVSPIVDCGVHYVDVMCQMTSARPVRVSAIGARLSDEIAADAYNYGQLQVVFADGSVGWYEAGWGPMISETAYFVKDVVGPAGSVSIAMPGELAGGAAPRSDEIGGHTSASRIRLHHAALAADGSFREPDAVIAIDDAPDHDALCEREQRSFLQAIRDGRDQTDHLTAALDSLRIVLAADRSVRTGQIVHL